MKYRFRLTLLLFGLARLSTAGFIVDPFGGTSVGFKKGDLAEQQSRNLGGTFNFFGFAITDINVATNGFLGTDHVEGLNADRSLTELSQTSTGPVIAAFYDLLQFSDGSSVTDRSVADSYYALTYQSIYGANDLAAGHTSDFQVVLFMADRTIGSFAFHPGDIAISYGTLASTIDNTFTVGVASDTNATGTPTSADGKLANFSTLPAGPDFLLYRPVVIPDTDGAIRYDVSVESLASVPEPATLALIGLGLVAVGCRKRRSRG